VRLLADYNLMASWLDEGETPVPATFVVDLHAGILLTDGVDPWAGILVDSDIPAVIEFNGQMIASMYSSQV
jgi:hypothetical protein